MPDGHAFEERNDHQFAARERPDLAPSPKGELGGAVPGSFAGDARLSMRAAAAPILATLQRQAGNRAVVERLGIQRIPDETAEGTPGADVSTAPTGDATGTGPSLGAGAGGGNQVISGDTVEINASSIVLNAASTRVNGLLQSDTLVTDTVIASTYTPGAGNIW
jgi:hypothetical protein